MIKKSAQFVWIFLFVLFGGTDGQAVESDREYSSSSQHTDPEKNSLLTRCFGPWGCLSIGEPFFSSLRPISLFPLHPDALDVQFLLATRSSPDSFQRIRPRKNSTFVHSAFDSQHAIKIILHGYRENGYQDWIKDLVRELLTSEAYNVISVDWRQGAVDTYPQAVANTRAVGLVVADFIDYLERRYRISPADIHIIGHDLGAHAAGYVGERVPRLGRISALDPAGPYFENTDPKVRLDLTDATFVDVIHADGSEESGVPSMQQPIGHVDFYPTPGWRRAGCNAVPAGVAEPHRLGRCSVLTATELFTESVNMDCPFYGFECDSYANLSSGHCREGCGSDMSKCAPMGFKAEEWVRFAGYEPVSMYLETGRDEPFCRYHYHVSIRLSGSEDSRRHYNETGLLFVKLTGTKGRTPLLQATPGFTVFVPGEFIEFVASSRNLGRLLRVDILWSPSPGSHPHSYRPELPVIHISRLRVSNLETGYREVFCGQDEPINPENIRIFFRGGIC